MNSRKGIALTAGLVVSIGLIAAAVSAWLVSWQYSRISFDLLNAVCGEAIEQDPDAQGTIAAALKEYTSGNPDGNRDVLFNLGYRVSDFSGMPTDRIAICAAAGLLAGLVLFSVTVLARNKAERRRIRELAAYLEQANMGQAPILSSFGEDDFSKLEDEIVKTVTYLYQTREQAVQAKNGFEENLSNIAHQIKTPITAISLAAQRMGESPWRDSYGLEQIERQVSRLTYLEESLLLLSRLDAGALPFHSAQTDVFTLLTLAADNLQELFDASSTSLDIPESGDMRITVDLEWTMEAVMNLMKNCIEHNPGGVVHCSYDQNPLYTEILLWDEGAGFVKEDLSHLFQRFYRGKNAGEGGIGIGLALAKEIIEGQNGTIRAKNRRPNGACFEIRLYRH